MSALLAAGGFNPPIDEQFRWAPIYRIDLGPIPLSINRPVVLLLFGTALVMFVFWLGMRRPQLVPTGLQNAVEAGFEFVRKEIIDPVIGPDGIKWWPYLTALFWFIFTLNIFEVIPLINFPVTFRSSITWPLAGLSLIIFVAVGFVTSGPVRYLKSVLFPPGAPKLIYPLLAVIEAVSTFFVRPFTLSIRLLANMISGHLILLVFWAGTAYLLQQAIHHALSLLAIFNGVFALVAFVLSIVLVGLEIVIDALQAYVFTILTAVYIAGAMGEEH